MTFSFLPRAFVLSHVTPSFFGHLHFFFADFVFLTILFPSFISLFSTPASDFAQMWSRFNANKPLLHSSLYAIKLLDDDGLDMLARMLGLCPSNQCSVTTLQQRIWLAYGFVLLLYWLMFFISCINWKIKNQSQQHRCGDHYPYKMKSYLHSSVP